MFIIRVEGQGVSLNLYRVSDRDTRSMNQGIGGCFGKLPVDYYPHTKCSAPELCS